MTGRADPSELPSFKADPYAGVNHADFSNAASMSKVAKLTMASLAHDRGDHEVSQKWKMLGLSAARDEEVAAQRAEIDKMMAPKKATPVHQQLVERQDDSPWVNDPEYVELADDVMAAEANLDNIMANHPEFSERSIEVGRLRQARDDRAREVREQALASGAWSEGEEAQRAARASVDDKAGKIARSINLGGSS